ncbi:hypothetical protein AGDE_11092 [Angomonas deanei]|nr:hypothetical protein AGDE_11092 [Angomonas deanei]|eukprot:EPY26786.1 hypothetical protein AGDE_11092 [Angomonas deanei]
MNESATTKPGKNKDDTVTCEVVPLDHTDSVFPKYLLQTGLARALGLQVPPLKTVEETVLGRVIDRGTGLYREERADRLCQTVVVEWFEDILLFIQRSGFNVVQTRCILLDALGVLRSLQELPPEAITSDAEMAVSHVLEDALVSQTCVLPTSVLERQVLLEEVRRTVPDPVILEGLQKRLREEKLNKKQQQALQAEMEQVPQVEVVSKEERVREVPTDVKIGPYFTLSEAACVLSYLCESALMHWRLWSCVLQPTAEVHSSPEPQRTVLVEDVPSFTMPPLAEFLPEDKHNFQVSRTLLLREAEDSLNRLYNEFESKWNDLKTECEEDHTRVKEILDIADEHNRHNALNPTEYDSVERAFTLRLNALMTKNASVGPLAAAMRPEQEEPAEEPVADQKGSKKKKSTPGKSAPVQLPDPDTIVLPDDAAFEVEEVERRVHRVEETYLEQSESKKKKR